MSFTTFTIYGERCTGTNFVRKLMFDNYDLTYDFLPDLMFGWKHFFGHEHNQTAIKKSTQCVILSIVRNPVDTLMSFWENPHHQSPDRLKDLRTFLTGEFYSVYDRKNNDEHWLDKNLDENRRFKNVFEMRNWKNMFLFQRIPALTQNCYFMRYEDLKADPVKIFREIEAKFGLTRKHSEFVVETKRIQPQSGKWVNFVLSENPLKQNYPVEDPEIKEIFKTHLDFETEALIGYSKESILSRLV